MKKKEVQTEQKIFDSASEIFSKKGFDGTRMQEIADHALKKLVDMEKEYYS